MPEILVQVRFTATKAYGVRPERIAYREFAKGIVDLTENANIIGALDENEESEIRMTIRALIEQRSRIPHGKAFIYPDKFDAAEQQLKKILEEEFFPSKAFAAMYQDDICFWVHLKHPEFNLSDETIKRRLRRIRAKGGLETDGDGRYWMKAKKETITA